MNTFYNTLYKTVEMPVFEILFIAILPFGLFWIYSKLQKKWAIANDIPLSVFPRDEWPGYIRLESMPKEFRRRLIQKIAYDSNSTLSELYFIAFSLPDEFLHDADVQRMEEYASKQIKILNETKK